MTIDDGHGGTVSQAVTVTITGTNDDPTITVLGTNAVGEVTEDATSPLLGDTGTIAFNDIDLIDVHTTNVAADAGNTLGGTLTMGAVSELARPSLARSAGPTRSPTARCSIWPRASR